MVKEGTRRTIIASKRRGIDLKKSPLTIRLDVTSCARNYKNDKIKEVSLPAYHAFIVTNHITKAVIDTATSVNFYCSPGESKLVGK